MSTVFKYNGKVYQAMSLDKKLKKLKINKEDIDILFEGELTQQELENKFLEITKAKRNVEFSNEEIIKYYFIDKDTKHTLVSIKKNVNDIPGNWEMMYEK